MPNGPQTYTSTLVAATVVVLLCTSCMAGGWHEPSNVTSSNGTVASADARGGQTSGTDRGNAPEPVKRGETALHRAAAAGDVTRVVSLLDQGADIDARDEQGQTPLDWAASAGRVRVFKILIERGADYEIDEHGVSPALARLTRALAEQELTEEERRVLNEIGQGPWPGYQERLNQMLTERTEKERKISYTCKDVEQLVAKGGDVNALDASGASPLHRAAEAGTVEAVKLLVQHGANVNIRDHNGRTPLHRAAAHVRNDIVEVLVAHGAKVNSKDNEGNTPFDVLSLLASKLEKHQMTPGFMWAAKETGNVLMWSAATRHGKLVVDVELPKVMFRCVPDELEALIAKGADIHRRDEMGQTPLHMAAGAGCTRGIEILLEHGADPNIEDRSGSTPLHAAARSGRLSAVRVLLARGVSVDARAKNGSTPLHRAARWGHRDVAELLVTNGARLDTQNCFDKTPCELASEIGDKEILEMLCMGRPDLGQLVTDIQLPKAMFRCIPDELEALIAKGADIHKKDRMGQNPLHIAAAVGCTRGIEILFEHGADPNTQDRLRRTPLHAAARYGQLAAVRMLLAHGADVNARRIDGNTPLHWAAIGGHSGIAELLVSQGAPLDAQNYAGETPCEFAQSGGSKEILQVLCIDRHDK